MAEEGALKMAFDKLIGQEKWSELLLRAWKNNRLAHAILISGAPGSGKETLALEMAKILNCTEEEQGSCGNCSACKRIDKLEHPNLQFIFPLPGGTRDIDDPLAGLNKDTLEFIQNEIVRKAGNPYYRIDIPGANVVRIDSVRSIRKNAYLKSAEPGKKVVIVSRAEKMNNEAANSFLKLLEEPPPDTYLFLTTSKPEVLVSTIRSRCQEIKLDRLEADKVVESILSAGATAKQAEELAELVDGDIGRALKLMEKGEYDERMETAEEIIRVINTGAAKDISSLNRKISILSKEGKEKLTDILKITLHKLIDEDVPGIMRSKVAMPFDKAIDLIGRNIYIPMIFTTLVYETRNLLKSKSKKPERNG